MIVLIRNQKLSLEVAERLDRDTTAIVVHESNELANVVSRHYSCSEESARSIWKNLVLGEKQLLIASFLSQARAILDKFVVSNLECIYVLGATQSLEIDACHNEPNFNKDYVIGIHGVHDDGSLDEGRSLITGFLDEKSRYIAHVVGPTSEAMSDPLFPCEIVEYISQLLKA